MKSVPSPPSPPGAAPFKPYAGFLSRAVSTDGSVYYAQLGSFGDDKATWRVHVWVVRPNGKVETVSIDNPPNDHSLFSLDAGRLILSGSRDKVNGTWVVPGFVAPATIDQAARELASQAGWQANQATKMAHKAQADVDALAARVEVLEG